MLSFAQRTTWTEGKRTNGSAWWWRVLVAGGPTKTSAPGRAAAPSVWERGRDETDRQRTSLRRADEGGMQVATDGRGMQAIMHRRQQKARTRTGLCLGCFFHDFFGNFCFLFFFISLLLFYFCIHFIYVLFVRHHKLWVLSHFLIITPFSFLIHRFY